MRLRRSQLLIKGSPVLSCCPTNLNASRSAVISEKAYLRCAYAYSLKTSKFQQTASWKCCDIHPQLQMCFLHYFKQSLYYYLKEKSTTVVFISQPILPSNHCGKRTSDQNENSFFGTQRF